MIFLDANIFMYAAGKPSPQCLPCQRLLTQAVSSGARYCTNAEVLQEILHRYRSIRAAELGSRVFDAVVGLRLPVLPVTADDVGRARRLLETYPGLSTRDGVHLGVMESHGIEEIISYDLGFDRVDWVRRTEPTA